MENLSEGDCCDCDCCDCDGGKTKSTPNLGFRLRLEFDNTLRNSKYGLVWFGMVWYGLV